MGYRCFEVEDEGAVAHVRLSRPDELNTMVPEFWSELPEIVQGLSDAGRIRCLVLSSSGKHFSAGMDLSVFAAMAGDGQAEPGRRHARTRSTVRLVQQTFTVLEQARFPVLAALHGGVIGGAVDLATACDVRYASADAFFVVQEINIGMTADVGTLQRLGSVVGQGFAREMAFTGRRVPAARAFEVGLVQQVLPDREAAVEAALETAREIAGKSPLAQWGTKVALNHARDHGTVSGLQQIADWQAGMFQPADVAEAMTARAEKRDPVFPDLLPEPRGLS